MPPARLAAGGLPVFPALSAGDVARAGSLPSAPLSTASPRRSAAGSAPPGIDGSGIPGAPPGAGARTHYAFDSSGQRRAGFA